MNFDWDPAKHDRNVAERGFGFDFAALIFDGETIGAVDDRKCYGEVRVRALGEVEGIVLSVVYTDRENVRWIIAAWKAGKKERMRWRKR